MESNLKKYYDRKNRISLIEKKGSVFNPNPFYLVNEFIYSSFKYKYLTDNYYDNIFNLKVLNEPNKKCLYSYDSEYNTVYSSNSKADIFALLNVASTDRFSKKSGVIKENIGYGLNYGITDFYNKKITRDKSFFPFESFVASVINKADSDILAKAYFDPKFNNLSELIPDDKYDSFLELIDKYHDNYLKLMKLYRYKFSEERYYFNLVYGETLRKRNVKLYELEDKINKLESENYTIVYDVLDNLVEFISNNDELTNKKKKECFAFMSSKLEKLLSKDELFYLNELNDTFKSNENVKRLVK